MKSVQGCRFCPVLHTGIRVGQSFSDLRLRGGGRLAPGEPTGTRDADGSHRHGCVCLEEKPKYISELVKLLRPSRE